MNYRNEYDRWHGELLGLGSPDKIKEAINMMMDKDKLKAIGEYKEPDSIGPVNIRNLIVLDLLDLLLQHLLHLKNH